IGVIPIDSIFSPVTRVKYFVEATRVGQNTDFDKLIMDVWTDGRISPQDALLQSSAILRKHLDVFVNYDDSQVEFDAAPEAQSEENLELRKLLNMSVNEIELSVRAANCLNNANIPRWASWPRRPRRKCSSTATSERSRSTRSRTS